MNGRRDGHQRRNGSGESGQPTEGVSREREEDGSEDRDDLEGDGVGEDDVERRDEKRRKREVEDVEGKPPNHWGSQPEICPWGRRCG